MSQIYLGDKIIASTEGSDIKYDENTSVNEKIDELNSNLQDTGWVDLVPLKGTWQYLKYRRIGNIINIRGYATKFSTKADEENIIANIPSEIAPPLEAIHFFGCMPKYRIVRLCVTNHENDVPNVIKTDWAWKIDTNEASESEFWLNFNISYMID